MFYDCTSLKSVNLKFDTSKITTMDYMFYNCSQISNLDISNFNLDNLKNSTYMFGYCGKLKNIKFNDNT